MTIEGQIKNGKVVLDDYQRDKLNQWKDKTDGKHFVAKFYEKKGTRSLKQNSYYWGTIIEMICNETGYSKDEAHHWLKISFSIETGIDLDEEGLFSTACLSTKEAETYYEYCRFIGEHTLGIIIPVPNEHLDSEAV